MKPSRRRPPLRRDLPGEIKVVMGFLLLYGFLSLFGLVSVLFSGYSLRFTVVAVPAGLLILNASLFVGLLLRSRWGWWGSTVTFGVFALSFGFLIVKSLISSSIDSAEELVSLGRFGTLGGIVFVGLYAVPFWLLISTRHRYWASKPVPAHDVSKP